MAPDIVDAPDATDLPLISSSGRVTLREVYFRYPGAPMARWRASASKPTPSQLVALVGPSGAGETAVRVL